MSVYPCSPRGVRWSGRWRPAGRMVSGGAEESSSIRNIVVTHSRGMQPIINPVFLLICACHHRSTVAADRYSSGEPRVTPSLSAGWAERKGGRQSLPRHCQANDWRRRVISRHCPSAPPQALADEHLHIDAVHDVFVLRADSKAMIHLNPLFMQSRCQSMRCRLTPQPYLSE